MTEMATTNDRINDIVESARLDGRISRERVGYWREALASNPHAETLLSKLAPGLPPEDAWV